MGLTFPWEPRCLDFNCCCSPCQQLGGASVFRRSSPGALPHCRHLTRASISPWSSYLYAKAWKSVLHMEPDFPAACLRAAIYIYITCSLPPACAMNFHCSQTRISNYTGTSSDEQDEFAMSFWPNHSQTTHGKLLYTITECKALSKCVNVKIFAFFFFFSFIKAGVMFHKMYFWELDSLLRQ